ncbi:MAG: hypothetical protein ACE5FU_03685, partial [Nitrospinota bacterium]
VFPYISIWFHYSLTADLIVVGSKTRHEFDLEQMKKSLALQPVRQGLKRIDVSTPYDFFEFFLIGNDDARGFLTGADINTDNRPILEFSLPKAQYTHTYGSTERVEKILQKVTNIFPPVKMPSSKTEKEEFYLKTGTVYRKDSFREAQTRKVFEKLLDLNPDNDPAKAYLNR